MRALVWVQAWQMQCCGAAFAVGEQVEWTLHDEPDREWLEAALGPEIAQRISHAQEHHGALPDETTPRRGRVLAIETAHGEYAPLPSEGGVLYPVASTAVMHVIERVDGREPNSGRARLNGYLVELELEPSPT